MMKSYYLEQNVKIMELLAGKISLLGVEIIRHVSKLSPKEEVLWDMRVKSFVFHCVNGQLVGIRREFRENKTRLVFDFLKEGATKSYPYNSLNVDTKIEVVKLLNELYNK